MVGDVCDLCCLGRQKHTENGELPAAILHTGDQICWSRHDPPQPPTTTNTSYTHTRTCTYTYIHVHMHTHTIRTTRRHHAHNTQHTHMHTNPTRTYTRYAHTWIGFTTAQTIPVRARKNTRSQNPRAKPERRLRTDQASNAFSSSRVGSCMESTLAPQ